MTDAVPSEGTPSTPSVPELRAGDADRERVAEILRDALAEGRLDMEEFEERLEATYKARTYGELTPITRDLPTAPGAPAVNMVKEPLATGSWAGRVTGGEGSSSWAVAIMSGFQRKGRWTVPKRFNCFAFWGGGEIDLREASFADREVEINCVAIMGGVNVIVPPGVEVVVRGIGVMGGFDHREEGVPGDPGGPRVIVTGFAFWGGVGVERKLTRAERQALKEERRRQRLDRKESMRELDESLRDDVQGAHHRHLDMHHDRMRDRRDRHRDRRERHRDRHDRRDGRDRGDRYDD
ncbi:DUF1707 domain-containing protein [Streptomyces sp. NBC_00663]|uniref:DUF1707 SHOCT-like domain-containing protein n=1 Tax=Streptomyces sp. NBC_00663 TaxID=2975801 RepID=UPI002E2FA542|nr:DUF1707 domain-containing protein [Streptomyces sp. NBC_00663]